MMDVSTAYLRFFLASCLFGIVIGVMGCATNNWSQPLFKNRPMHLLTSDEADDADDAEGAEKKDVIKSPKSFWKQGFGEMSGIDPRSREIERSLGF